MNIFNYINTQEVLLRPFVYPVDKSPLVEFTAFDSKMGGYSVTDPSFVQYEPYKYGYTFSFYLRISDNLSEIKKIVDGNKMVEVLVNANIDQSTYYRIGDKSGFKIADFRWGRINCPQECVIKLQSIKPNLTEYETLIYTNNNNFRNGRTKKNTVRKRVFKIR